MIVHLKNDHTEQIVNAVRRLHKDSAARERETHRHTHIHRVESGTLDNRSPHNAILNEQI